MTVVSVLLPCRNAALCIDAAILGLLAQTFGNFEVLAWNDCSDDGTLGRRVWVQSGRAGSAQTVRLT